MPRTLRLILPGQPLHLVQRGNNRGPMFLRAEDRMLYRDVLLEGARRHDCAIHSYVFMTNHVHLLLTPLREDGPARLMQHIGRKYVQRFNRLRLRTGTLYEGRYYSSVIDSERYLFACARYVEMNPVRAGMAAGPEEYQWSSFMHNAWGKGDELVSPHAAYCALGESREQQLSAYRTLFETFADDAIAARIRLATRQGLRLSAIL